jgi:hypothetical protein
MREPPIQERSVGAGSHEAQMTVGDPCARAQGQRGKVPPVTKRFESLSSSDSGVFMLDPEERRLLEAAAAGIVEDEPCAHARFLEAARRLPRVRLDKVMKVREEIAAGTYVTQEKLEATVARLLAALRG